MTVGLTLFGAPTIAFGGKSVALGFERRTQLLVYLALKRGWVARAELAALLWPDQDSKLANTNLRKALFRLQALPGAERIEVQPGALRFEARTDVHDFEAALREQRSADALTLHRGDLLAGFDDGRNEAWSGWLNFERDRLSAAWRAAAHAHLAGDVETAQAVDLALRLLDADPFDEAALRIAMKTLAQAGQVGRARQHYLEFVARLADELGLEPGAELKALHDQLGASSAVVGMAQHAAVVRTDDTLIGRTVELRRVLSALAQVDCRLLTVTGPGGVGKTRLAHRIVAECATSFADGAIFVPLDELTTPGELGGRLARELDVPLKGRTEPLEQVVDALRTRRRLLVLDNFEQIVDAAPMLERLLAACPHVKAVVTSRVRLNLASEWLLPLEGLPYPEDEDREQLESFDAARLFVRSARRVRPDLMPAAEASAIIDICRQVEGLPLALELAAAWTRVLSCAAIAHELRHGMELLQAADSTRPARHASIDVVFEQSWRLLTDIERDVLARLSVFHGSFMPEAARKVARAPLPVLGALADKSLLQRDGARIRLHPLVQQLASVRLGERQAREAHGEYVRFFSQLMHRWQRPVENGDREALSLIEADFENCRAAWNRAVDLGDTAALKRSVSTLTNFCDHRSRPSAGLALLRLASDSVASGSDSAWLALLLGKAAHLEYRLDRYSEAMALAADGLATLGPIPDADARGQCLLVLGTCELRLGKYRRALEYLEESLALSPECSDVRHRAGMLTAMALAHKGLGDYDETLRLTLEALQEQRRTGDVASEAMSLNNLAAFYLERLQFDVAAGYLTTALVICERHGLTGSLGAVLINLMIADAKSGRYDAAAIHGARALEHARAIGNRFYLSFIRLQFVAIALARCDLDSARGELRQGMELALEIGRPVLFIQGLSAFGEILQAQGEAACAHAVTRFAIDHPSTAPLDRDEMIQKLDKWPALTGPVPPWPDWSLEELAHRIMVETSVAYAPLIAALRGLH